METLKIIKAIEEVRFANYHLTRYGDDGSGYVERLGDALDVLVAAIPTVKNLLPGHTKNELLLDFRKIMILLWGDGWRNLAPFEFGNYRSLAAFAKNPQGE